MYTNLMYLILNGEEIERADSSIPQWKTLSSKDLGIDTSMISKPTRVVLNGLRKQGTLYFYGTMFGVCDALIWWLTFEH